MLYQYFSKSYLNAQDLANAQKVENDKAFKILKFFDVRWLSKFNCVDHLRKCYGSVLDVLRTHIKKEDEKGDSARKLYDYYRSYPVILYTYMLSDILEELNKVFKDWQKEDLSISEVQDSLENLYQFFNETYLLYQKDSFKMSNLEKEIKGT